ncbi:MAG: hypothetical protein HRU43_05010 [Simkaniaceae bacterium]|nr:hypothetical protein [Simkaniaceae bacterium]
MEDDINFDKAMEMVNSQLREMRSEMDEIDEMELTGEKKKLALCMKRIYKRVVEVIDVYAKSQEHGDFNNVCRELEALKPAFVLNYNEICYDQNLETLNQSLDEMEKDLEEIDEKHLSGERQEKADEMHQIYDDLNDKVDKFAHSHDPSDFKSARDQMEKLKPEFILNYNELSE